MANYESRQVSATSPAREQVESARHDQSTGARTSALSGRQGIGLCLSGGGYRAALFHLGALRRLNELGALGQMQTVSGVSGGAIAANLLADPRLGWPGTNRGPVQGFDEFVAAPMAALTSRNTRTPALLARFKPSNWAMPDSAVRALADRLADAVPWWSGPMRDNKSEGPAIIVGATDVAYGVDWIFANPTAARPKGRIGDYRLGYAEPPPDMRLADAVAASCAFPPFFAPMTFNGNDLRLRGGRFGDEAPGQEAAVRELVRLTDGGVYDNLALEPVWKNHQTVIVSDGGGVFKARSERTLWGRLLQILSIANGGGSSVRLRWLHASFARRVMSGVTWGLDTVALQGYPLDVVELINVVRTDLDAFSQQEQHILERHGYHVADQAVHRYWPELVHITAPLEPPHSDVADPVIAAQALRRSAMRTVLGRW